MNGHIDHEVRGEHLALEDRCRLVLAVSRAMFVNGESTDQTITAGERLAEVLGLRARIVPHWGELQLLAEDASLSRVVAADPAGVNMTRVVSAMRIAHELGMGKLTLAAACEEIDRISRVPPAPTWLFTLAAGAGALALALIYGARHVTACALILLSAAAGAVLRRCLGRYNDNLLLQPFCAALLAGTIGALAARFQLSSSLRLIAVCPCMILVPGPHILNGGLDLIQGRMSLGAARLLYAGLVVLAISVGLLLAFTLLGVSLPINPESRAVSIWEDIIPAGVAVAAFSIFYSKPLYMFPWPVVVGMLAHGVRWWTLSDFGYGAPIGAFAACLLVGTILAPVSRRWDMPFAAIGFASVVSMMPGIYLFRTASGLLQLADASHATLDLIGATISNGMMATTVIVAMSLGLVVPKLIFDRLWKCPRHASS